MKSTSTTEKEYREEKAPTPPSISELAEYIESLVSREHDYGTCVYAMSLAAQAAFNFVASNLGVTGFQASCADLNFIGKTRHIDGPFMLLTADKMLYPQYSLEEILLEAMERWKPWAAEQCAKNLAGNCDHVSPAVKSHWEILAASHSAK